jgi:hypothetical protein
MTGKIARRLGILLPAVAATGLLFTGSAAAQPSIPAAVAAGHRIQIHEIFYNSPGPDTGSNASLNAEWVELHNTSGTKISLRNWTLRDAAGHVFVFHRYSLGGHRFVKIHTGHGTGTRTDRYWNRSAYVWNNTGDTAKLRDNLGGRVDRCSYTGTSDGFVFC